MHQIHLSFLMPLPHLLDKSYPFMVIANKKKSRFSLDRSQHYSTTDSTVMLVIITCYNHMALMAGVAQQGLSTESDVFLLFCDCLSQ